MSMAQSAFPPRRNSVGVQVGSIRIGGGAPIVVQSMTNTDTEDEIATTVQVAQLARAGSELVRITVNTAEAAKAVPGWKVDAVVLTAEAARRGSEPE